MMMTVQELKIVFGAPWARFERAGDPGDGHETRDCTVEVRAMLAELERVDALYASHLEAFAELELERQQAAARVELLEREMAEEVRIRSLAADASTMWQGQWHELSAEHTTALSKIEALEAELAANAALLAKEVGTFGKDHFVALYEDEKRLTAGQARTIAKLEARLQALEGGARATVGTVRIGMPQDQLRAALLEADWPLRHKVLIGAAAMTMPGRFMRKLRALWDGSEITPNELVQLLAKSALQAIGLKALADWRAQVPR